MVIHDSFCILHFCSSFFIQQSISTSVSSYLSLLHSYPQLHMHDALPMTLLSQVSIIRSLCTLQGCSNKGDYLIFLWWFMISFCILHYYSHSLCNKAFLQVCPITFTFLPYNYLCMMAYPWPSFASWESIVLTYASPWAFSNLSHNHQSLFRNRCSDLMHLNGILILEVHIFGAQFIFYELFPQ